MPGFKKTPITKFEAIWSIDAPTNHAIPRQVKELHIYDSNLALLKHSEECKTYPTNSTLLLPFCRTWQGKEREASVVVKNWPPSRCWHMSKRPFTPSRGDHVIQLIQQPSPFQILLEYHHFPKTFSSRKIPPHPGATSRPGQSPPCEFFSHWVFM